MTTIIWTTTTGIPLTLSSQGGTAIFSISGEEIPSGVISSATISLTGRSTVTQSGGQLLRRDNHSISSPWDANSTTITIYYPHSGNWGVEAGDTQVFFEIYGASLNVTGATLTIIVEDPPVVLDRRYPYYSVNVAAGHRYFCVASIKTSNAGEILDQNPYPHPDIIIEGGNRTIVDSRVIENVNTFQLTASVVDIVTEGTSKFIPLSSYNGNVSFETTIMGVFDITGLGLSSSEECISYFQVSPQRIGRRYVARNILDFAVSKEIFTPATDIIDNTIYNRYWGNYISDLYSINTRIMECYCHFEDIDKAFKIFHIYDNSTWILSKVENWEGDTGKCKGTFIKVNDKGNYLSAYNSTQQLTYTSFDGEKIERNASGYYYPIGHPVPLMQRYTNKGEIFYDKEVNYLVWSYLINSNRLKSIFIPFDFNLGDEDGIVGIKNPIAGCRRVEKIEVDEGNPYLDSRYDCNAIIHTTTNTLYAGCKNTTIPEGILKIGIPKEEQTNYIMDYNMYTLPQCAFYNVKFENLVIPSSVTDIYAAFSSCSFENVTVQGNNFRWENGCIIDNNRNKLVLGTENSVIPNNVTEIEDYAFIRNEYITSITIPSNVTNLNYGIFFGCNNLTEIIMDSSVPPMLSTEEIGEGRMFYSEPENLKIKVPANAVNTYLNDSSWTRYTSYIISR